MLKASRLRARAVGVSLRQRSAQNQAARGGGSAFGGRWRPCLQLDKGWPHAASSKGFEGGPPPQPRVSPVREQVAVPLTVAAEQNLDPVPAAAAAVRPRSGGTVVGGGRRGQLPRSWLADGGRRPC